MAMPAVFSTGSTTWADSPPAWASLSASSTADSSAPEQDSTMRAQAPTPSAKAISGDCLRTTTAHSAAATAAAAIFATPLTA